MALDSLAPEHWAQQQFGTAALHHARRTQRLVRIATLAAQRPGGSLPQLMQHPADLEACYRLMNRPETTHAAVLQPHLDATRQRLHEATTTVLIIKDITELDFTTRTGLTDLGQIGNGGRRGYLCSNSLAVTADTEQVLGLIDQRLYRRPQVGRTETPAQRRTRTNRQSRLWVAASDAVGTAPPGQHWLEVSDREADTFEYFDRCRVRGRHFLVRSKTNRQVTYETPGGVTCGKLHDFARAQPELTRRTIRVPAQLARAATATTPARPALAARAAAVAVSAGRVSLQPPQRPRGEHGREPLAVSIVRVWEPTPPPGAEDVEWFLLRDEVVSTAAQAAQTCQWYESRWLVEDYHKGQKTGCRIEGPQFMTTGALEPVIALLSVVAVLLLQLRSVSRLPAAAEQPATTVVPELYVRVLHAWRWPNRVVDPEWTVKEWFWALGRLGGHQNRKGDGPPGWIVLWRGWTQLLARIDAVQAMTARSCGVT